MNTINVLIIDDDEFSCDGTKIILLNDENYHFKTTECKTLKEALSLNLDEFDIILLDMILSDSKGVNLYKSISKNTKTPIIILSGYPDLAEKAATAGAQAYLIKPVLKDTLVQTIVFVLEKYLLKNKILFEEKKFKKVIEGISDSIIIYRKNKNGDYMIDEMNYSAEVLEKVDKNEVKGKNARDVFYYIDYFNFDKKFDKVLKSGKSINTDLERYPDGTWRTNYIYKLSKDSIVNICYNKTDVVNILKNLEEKERMLRCAFNFNRDIIFITDLSYNILDRNRSFNKFLKFSYIKDKKINIYDIWKNSKERDEFLRILENKKENLNKECVLVTKNNIKLYCIISAYILNNKIYYFIHDITKEKIQHNFMMKSRDLLSDVIDSKIKDWKKEEEIRVILRKEKIDEIDSIIDEIEKFNGGK